MNPSAPQEGGPSADKLDRPLPEDDPNFRADLVARIRREIVAGQYGTDEQLEQAVQELLKRLDQGNP